MELQDLEEENMGVHSYERKLLDHSSRPGKGGLRTMPFIIVNESFERVASSGLMSNMVFYLINGYHMEAATASIVISLWSAMSNALAIFGAFLSDSYLGRFRVIVLGSFSSLLGTTLLWLTAMIPQLKPLPCNDLNYSCYPPTLAQLAILISSFGFISIGAGCIRPCSIAFGAEQLDNKENPNNERVLQSFFNWYYASIGISTVLALTVTVYIQDHLGWKIGFGVAAVLMFFSALTFLMGSSLFIKGKAHGSLFTVFLQVLVAAVKNRNIILRPNSANCYHTSRGVKRCAPTENLRCLNKACIITDPERDLNPDGTALNPWSLCTVEQVELLKALLRVIPMWSSGFMLLVSTNNSFATLQAETMDRHVISDFEIPAGSFNVVMVVTLTIWVALYDRAIVPLLARYMGRPSGLDPIVRMGIGLILSCLSMAISAVTESVRRRMAIEEGLEDDPSATVDMSVMWLVPQYCLLGLAEAFNSIAQIEFFYTLFPKSMSSLAVALYILGMAVSSLVASLLVSIVDDLTTKGGKVSWLSTNLNKGHLDYYYWLLFCLSLVNFLYFLICCRAYERNRNGWERLSDEVAEEETECTDLPSA